MPDIFPFAASDFAFHTFFDPFEAVRLTSACFVESVDAACSGEDGGAGAISVLDDDFGPDFCFHPFLPPTAAVVILVSVI